MEPARCRTPMPRLSSSAPTAVRHRVSGALLEKLSPAERAVYVLREAFDYPYREISEVLPLSEANARQLITRARRRLAGEHRRPINAGERQRFLDAFVVAAKTGELARLEQLLTAEMLGTEFMAAYPWSDQHGWTACN
jgi:DNA-binding CsgD family transcriptional regulator